MILAQIGCSWHWPRTTLPYCEDIATLAKGLTEALETKGGKRAYMKGIVVFEPKGLQIVERKHRNSFLALGTYSEVIMGS